MILRWDAPPKVLTTQEWKGITADNAPPGVYTPNMSHEDELTWRAKLITGKNRRVEIRKTVTGKLRPHPRLPGLRAHAQLKVIVDSDSVRLSANGTADFTAAQWDELPQAVEEARKALEER
jgi:hypothetical protein